MKNSQSKLVTVVIPTFKRAGKLKKALRSVMLQSFKNFDVIVVDDNTNNEESAKVRKICISNNVNYIKNFRKKGGCGSRNSAILSTSSKYIAFLDDDDLWLANKLKVQFDFLNKNSNYSAVYSNFYKYYQEINLLVSSPKKHDLNYQDLLKGRCPASTSLVMVNRKLLFEAGLFDEELPSFQDYDMWIRLTKIKPIGFVNKNLAIFTQHSSDRVSINLEKRFQGLNLIVRKWGREINKHNNVSKFINKFKSEAYESNALAQTGHSYLKMITFRTLSVVYNKYCFSCWKRLLISFFGGYVYNNILRFKLKNNLAKTKYVLDYLKLVEKVSNKNSFNNF